MKSIRRLRYLCLVAPLALAACDSPEDDLRAWMNDVHRRHHPVPVTVVPAKGSPMLRYEPGSRSDPFSAALLAATDTAASGPGLQPDLKRTREPLEAHSLTSLRLIGSLRRSGDVIALIEVDKRVHSVRVGNYVGQDFGRVMAIGERAIEIDELVPDSGGTWTKRRVQLAVQETR